MDLEALKAENAAEEEETADQVVDEPGPVADEIDAVVADPDETPEVAAAVEPWQETEAEPGSVPVGAHVKLKHKLKGRISEQADELSKLKAEIEALKSSGPAAAPDASALKRPRSDDFDTDEDYNAALDKYDDHAALARFNRIETQRKQSESAAALKSSVDSHYDRAGKLVDESGIAPETYNQADAAFRTAINEVAPGKGNLIVDQIFSILGEGSEKVGFYVGRNKAVRQEVQNLLVTDPSGMKLAAFLGQQKERLNNPKRQPSKAPAPASKIKGDATTSGKGGAAKRTYDDAHKKGNPQAAYNAKKAARAAGVDVSAW